MPQTYVMLTQRLHFTTFATLTTMIQFIMRIEKRVTRNSRKINQVDRRVAMLREEVDSLIKEVDEMQRKLEIAWDALRDATREQQGYPCKEQR